MCWVIRPGLQTAFQKIQNMLDETEVSQVPLSKTGNPFIYGSGSVKEDNIMMKQHINSLRLYLLKVLPRPKGIFRTVFKCGTKEGGGYSKNGTCILVLSSPFQI